MEPTCGQYYGGGVQFLCYGAGGFRSLMQEMFGENILPCMEMTGESRTFANKLFVIYKFVKFGWAVLNFIVKEDEVKGISDPKGNASL